MKQPIISILIATRNRIPYCINVIETILSFDYEDFELVIQDNSDTLELNKYIAKREADKRLVYNYTPPPFSSIDNFNAVIGLAKGEYLCLIGDDDGINPEIFKLVEWAFRNNIDAITPGLNAMYRWPDACKLLEEYENDNGNLSILRITGNVNIHESKSSIKQLMYHGGQDYLKLHFPKLYHGIVKKMFLEKIKEKTGNFVGGLSPDIYIAVALTAFIKKTIEINYPVTIPGLCAEPLTEGHMSKFESLEEAPHFRYRGPYSWSQQVPKFYSASNIWADSALASLYDMSRFNLIKMFNIEFLTIKLLLNHDEYSTLIKSHYYKWKRADNLVLKMFYRFWLIYYKSKYYLHRYSPRTLNRIKRAFKQVFKTDKSISSPISLNNIENINIATKSLNNHLKNNSLSIEAVIEKLNKLLTK